MPQRVNCSRKESIDARVASRGMLAGLDRVVLGRQAEGVVAHRVDHLEAVAAAEVGDRVADRVVLQVADVRLARGVGQHLEHVGLRLRGVEPGLAGVRDLPGALGVPDLLPAALDRVGVVLAGSSLARESRGEWALEQRTASRAYDCVCRAESTRRSRWDA